MTAFGLSNNNKYTVGVDNSILQVNMAQVSWLGPRVGSCSTVFK